MVKFRVELAAFGVCGLHAALTTAKEISLTTWLIVVDVLSEEFVRLGFLSRDLLILAWSPVAKRRPGRSSVGSGSWAGSWWV